MKKRGPYLILYILFIGLVIFLSLDDYCIYRSKIQSDTGLVFGLLYLVVTYGLTFWVFTFLLHKMTQASYGTTMFFVLLSIPIAFLLDPYVYNRDHFSEFFNFFHDEFQLYVSLLYISLLTLFALPMYFIGKNENIRRKAIEDAMGKRKTN